MPTATSRHDAHYHIDEHDPIEKRWFAITAKTTEEEADARLRELHSINPNSNYRVHGPCEGNFRNSSSMLRDI